MVRKGMMEKVEGSMGAEVLGVGLGSLRRIGAGAGHVREPAAEWG